MGTMVFLGVPTRDGLYERTSPPSQVNRRGRRRSERNDRVNGQEGLELFSCAAPLLVMF